MKPEELVAILALSLVGGVYLYWDLVWRRRPRKYNVAIVDGPSGVERTRWVHVDGRDTFEYQGKRHHAAPLTGDSGYLVKRGYATEVWKFFTIGKTGTIQVPTRALLELPRSILEDMHDHCLARIPSTQPGVQTVAVYEAGLREYCRAHAYDMDLMRGLAVELAHGVRVGRADDYQEASWKHFVLSYSETLGWAAVAFVAVGAVLGINLMMDPYFYALLVTPTASWILVGLLAGAVLLASWGSKR